MHPKKKKNTAQPFPRGSSSGATRQTVRENDVVIQKQTGVITFIIQRKISEPLNLLINLTQ